ncbi:hypothetical protein OBCHQ24_06760 [Oceanobacillus iheyensis]|nr:hypothetical protein OBCHQ24_06760 [Oceanobacillus iheyensis]
MKLNNRTGFRIFGWVLFLCAVGFFCVQMGYLLVHERYNVEYVDNRLFYLINSLWAMCLALSILLLLKVSKKIMITIFAVMFLFIVGNGILLVGDNKETKNITSLSSDWKHVLSMKQDVETGQTTYYRSYYGILARPKEVLPNEVAGDVSVEWLANDVATFTYEATDDSVQQFIATYGDRGDGGSYYYVGAQIQGQWQAENVQIVSNTEGIPIKENGETELFPWENIEQFGTLAISLKGNNGVWSIALNENFEIHADPSKPTDGNITLYKASLQNSEPILLDPKTNR